MRSGVPDSRQIRFDSESIQIDTNWVRCGSRTLIREGSAQSLKFLSGTKLQFWSHKIFLSETTWFVGKTGSLGSGVFAHEGWNFAVAKTWPNWTLCSAFGLSTTGSVAKDLESPIDAFLWRPQLAKTVWSLPSLACSVQRRRGRQQRGGGLGALWAVVKLSLGWNSWCSSCYDGPKVLFELKVVTVQMGTQARNKEEANFPWIFVWATENWEPPPVKHRESAKGTANRWALTGGALCFYLSLRFSNSGVR